MYNLKQRFLAAATLTEAFVANGSLIIDAHSLLEQLETLRRLDSGCRVFGASKHRYQLNAPARPEKLREFETQHSIKLPDDYCQYLSEVSNGGAGPNYGVIEIERAASGHVPSLPFPICNIDANPHDTVFDHNRIDGAIWLSDNGCATFDTMVVNGALAGSVWAILEDEQWFQCYSFEKWFVGWLKSAIKTIQREPLLRSVRKGMLIDEVRSILGNEVVPVPVERRANGYGISFFDCNAHFLFSSEDRLLKCDHHSHIICPRVEEATNNAVNRSR